MGKDEGMRRRPAAALVAPLILLVLASGVLGWLPGTRPSEHLESSRADVPAAAAVLDALAALPLGFEPNVGQAEAGVEYVARGPGYLLTLSPTEAAVVLPDADQPLRMELVGSNPTPRLTGRDPLPGRTNYLTGGDPATWQSDVPTFATVSYADVWPGVDLIFLGDQRRLRHDFVVGPGTDPSVIAVDFPAAAEVTIDPATGDLLVDAARLSRPTIYQDVDGRRRPVEGAFRLLGGAANTQVGFTVGPYDRAQPLVIDPTLVTSSYLGGAGIDNATAVEVDGGGNVYIVGSTESTDLRTTNPAQATLNGDGSAGKSDAFVAKLNPEGTALLFATYLGGTNRDAAAGVAVGTDGSVFVTGVTESDNFPKSTPAAQVAYGGGPSDAFITKLNANGSAVAWSTFLGGDQTDAARAVAVSATGEAFVTGSTNSVGFPTANALQQTPPRDDDVDAFVAKVAADGSSFAFSTRLGGDSDDHGLDIAVDPTGNAYVTGDTRSPGFPTARPVQPGAGGSAAGVAGSFSDAFVSKFGPAGNNLVYSTFLGGSDTDQGTAITVDGEGAAYVTGTTNSPNFPVAAPLQTRKDNDTDAFVTKVNPAGSTLVYSTYLGGGGADTGTGVVVDMLGAATVAGTTGSTNFPTAKPFQGVKAGGATDAFVASLTSAGDALVASSYLGGREDDQATGIAIVPGAGAPVVVGSTSSADFPTAKPLQPSRAGAPADAFVTRVSAAEADSPATTATGGATGAVTTVPAASSSTHDRRVRLLVATTAGLFLIAVLQTAYLRRRAASADSGWGPDQPEPLVPPPPVQTWGGGVRLLDDETSVEEDAFASAVEGDDWADDLTQASQPVVGVPDLLDEGWAGGSPAPVEPPPVPLRPAPRVPLEELSFWDLFPEDLPPSRRPGALEEADWALEDQEDVLVGPATELTPPPPPPPLPPMPGPWGDVDPILPEPPLPAAGTGQDGPDGPEDNLLLTELLDLSPANTQAANAAHYGSLIGAGGGDLGSDFDDAWDDIDGGQGGQGSENAAGDGGGDGSGDIVIPTAAGAPVRSGSGSGPGTSGPKRKRKRGSGKRRPRPEGGPGSGSGGSGSGGSGSGGAGGPSGGAGGNSGGSGGGVAGGLGSGA
jgi:hypothetical protein